MAHQATHEGWLKQDFSALIDRLELPDTHKNFLRIRWLDQLMWTSTRADGDRNRYYVLRLTAIIGGVIVPALVSLNVSGGASSIIRWVTFSLSLLVAISVAVEEFFHYGERWRHYRRTAEVLKSEGWQFFQRSGPYRRYESHAEAYPAFAGRIEDIVQREVEVYTTEVVPEKPAKKEEPG